MDGLVVRRFSALDSVSEVTSLLHRAYASLAALGLRYVATWQDDDITLNRISEGECYVAELEGSIVGTIVLRLPEQTAGCEWYDRPEVASFGQFGIEPALKGRGIGDTLLRVVEERARGAGARELALDTAEPATHLIDYYSRRGYRLVSRVDWESTNYVSVVMTKTLA